jgi:hypothetical protein
LNIHSNLTGQSYQTSVDNPVEYGYKRRLLWLKCVKKQRN